MCHALFVILENLTKLPKIFVQLDLIYHMPRVQVNKQKYKIVLRV